MWKLLELIPFLKDARNWWKKRSKRKDREKLDKVESEFLDSDDSVDGLLND